MPNVFEALSYVNPSGKTVKISDTSVTKYWELRGRSGFAAPDVELITQKFANGTTKVLKRFIAPRTVRINMVLVGDTTAERDQYFAEMVRDLIDIGGGNTGQLYITRSDGTTVYLNCIYSSGMNVVDEYRKFHRFTLEFYASDPYFYKDQTWITLMENRSGGGSIYSLMGPPITVVNNGDAPIQPVIRIKNSVSDNAPWMNFRINGTVIFSIYFRNITTYDTFVIDTRDNSKDIYIIDSINRITSAWNELMWSVSSMDVNIPVGTSEVSIDFGGAYNLTIGKAEMLLANRFLSA